MTRNRLYRFIVLASLAGYALIGYLWMNIQEAGHDVLKVCLFKRITGIPCPSCGATHSIVSLLHGDFKAALMENPLGIILALCLLIFPTWVVFDYLKRKNNFYLFYLEIESLFRKKYIAIPAIAMVLINWIWNIHKSL